MSASVGSSVKSRANDGFFGKKDLEATAVSMLDGKGITKTEKASWTKAVTEVLADKKVRTNQETRDAFTDLKGRMKNFSDTKGVFAPTLNQEEVKNIVGRHMAASRFSSGGEG